MQEERDGEERRGEESGGGREGGNIRSENGVERRQKDMTQEEPTIILFFLCARRFYFSQQRPNSTSPEVIWENVQELRQQSQNAAQVLLGNLLLNTTKISNNVFYVIVYCVSKLYFLCNGSDSFIIYVFYKLFFQIVSDVSCGIMLKYGFNCFIVFFGYSFSFFLQFDAELFSTLQFFTPHNMTENDMWVYFDQTLGR